MSSLGSHYDVVTYIYKQLSAQKPNDPPTWWIQAEVLASVADFWPGFKDNPTISPVCQAIVDQAKKNYLSAIRSKDADHLWFDDYGWWGLAFAKLAGSGKAELKGLVDSDAFAQMAVDCATANAKGKSSWASATPEQRQDRDFAPKGPPAVVVPVAGGDPYPGLWNANYQMLQNVRDKHPDWDLNLVAIQNTVTNADYLLLCLRLAELLGEKEDGRWTREAKSGASWFHDWITKNTGYLRPNGLICERVPSMPDFQPQGYWAGDQGIWLGVLSGLWGKESALRASLTDYLSRLLQSLPMDSDGKRPLNDADLPTAANDATDYATGREVLLRELTGALVRFKNLAHGDPDAADMLGKIKNSPPLAHVRAWAQALKWPPSNKFEFSAAGAHLAVVVADFVMSQES